MSALSTAPTAPASARLVAWGNAWLGGHIGLQSAVTAITAGSSGHVVLTLGPAIEQPLELALVRMRDSGLRAFALALPMPGDPLGLAGPGDLVAAAIDAGEAVLAVGRSAHWGLVPAPDLRGSSYRGTAWKARPAQVPRDGEIPSLPEAERQLTEATREATELLVALDVAKMRPDVAADLQAVREGVAGRLLAPGYAPRAHAVLARAIQLRAIVQLAHADDGAAVSASQIQARTEALTQLDRVARRAVVAACNEVPTGLERPVAATGHPAEQPASARWIP